MIFHTLRDPGADGVGVAFTSEPLNLSDLQDADARAAAFAELSDALGVRIATATQVHGDRVIVVDAAPADALPLGEADALLTTVPGVALAIRVADCAPVLLADPMAGVIGAAHAGRKGVLSHVVTATVEAMRTRGARDIRAWIGPHICGPCYEVPDDMASDFERITGVSPATTPAGTMGADLGAALHRELDALGVPFESLEDCTRTTPTLPSYRRDGASSGRMAGLVWLACP